MMMMINDWATGWTGRGSNSSKVFFSSSKSQNPLWGPRNLLFSVHRGSSFLGIKRPENDDNSPQCSPNLQLYFYSLPPPNILSRLGQEQLYRHVFETGNSHGIVTFVAEYRNLQSLGLCWHLCLTFKRRIKSHLPFAGIIRSSPYSPRFQDNG